MQVIEQTLKLKTSGPKTPFYDSILFCFKEIPKDYGDYVKKSVEYGTELRFDGIPLLTPDEKSLIRPNNSGFIVDSSRLKDTANGLGGLLSNRTVSVGLLLDGLISGVYQSDHSLFLKMVEDPDSIKKSIDLYSQNLRKVLIELQDFVDFFIIIDPLTSNSIISPKHFRDFCIPFYSLLCNAISKPLILHSPGKNILNIEGIVESGFSGLQPIDSDDLSAVLEKSLNRLCIIGNMDKNIIQTGEKDEVYTEVERCRIAFREKNYAAILHTNFWIRRDTPYNKVKLLMEVIK